MIEEGCLVDGVDADADQLWPEELAGTVHDPVEEAGVDERGEVPVVQRRHHRPPMRLRHLEAFRRQFRRATHTTPSAYRQAFGTLES